MSVRERLPADFVARMRGQLGEESEEFLSSYERECCSGIRINTGKIAAEEAVRKLPFDLRPVPWTDNGFYVCGQMDYTRQSQERGPDYTCDCYVQAKTGLSVSCHPWYYAGLYYIQEPSAMLPASLLPIQPGDRVLDLCAAPGGKATELASRLKGRGLLVANDISASRARALVKNLALWGAANVCVTAETPERLYRAFGCFFDKILVDAPCSGEGMFRKDSALIASWRKKGPADYAPLQKEILSWAVRMLQPGGMLLYSTCTFSEEEDEAVVADTLKRYPELALVQPPMTQGFAPGRGPERCVRLYPHRIEGEGHFAALFQKRGAEEPGACLSYEKESIHLNSNRRKDGGNAGLLPEEVQKFLTRIMQAYTSGKSGQEIENPTIQTVLETFRYEQIGEQCLLVPPFDLPRNIRFLRTGVRIGTWKRGRFEPSQELALLLGTSCFDAVLDLETDDGRISRYLKGETIMLTDAETDRLPDGWVLVCVDGHGLGWGKCGNETLKNKYHPAWRLQ